METCSTELSAEEFEFLVSGKHRTRLPKSSSESLIFPVSESGNFFALPSADNHFFQDVIKKAEISASIPIKTLSKLKAILTNRASVHEVGNELYASAEEETDDLPVFFLKLATFCFLLFFALIITSGYYNDDDGLWIAAAIVAAVGLLILFVLVMINGDCRRIGGRLRSTDFSLTPMKRGHILDFLAVANKEIQDKCLEWRLGKNGNYVQLHFYRDPTPKAAN